MARMLILAMLLMPLQASAQWFAEVGVGHQLGGCLRDGWDASYDKQRDPRFIVDVHCSPNPLGLASIGYQWRSGFVIRWDHWSSLVEKDRGLDVVSVRYRVEW